MFQTVLGRIGNIIECPPRSLDMQVFVDAAGKAGNKRVWGGLAAIGDSEITWMDNVLDDIAKDQKQNQELKGRDLDTSVIKDIGRKILEDDRRIIFWANWILDWRHEKSDRLSCRLEDALKSLKANPLHLERNTIENLYNSNSAYFSNLKQVNKHKLLSIIVHLQWLLSEIKRVKIGHQLKSVRFIIDKENFPKEEKCGALVKTFISASLQSTGMDISLTGKSFREDASEGSVVVDIAGESEKNVGIRYVDILIQAVLRKVYPLE